MKALSVSFSLFYLALSLYPTTAYAVPEVAATPADASQTTAMADVARPPLQAVPENPALAKLRDALARLADYQFGDRQLWRTNLLEAMQAVVQDGSLHRPAEIAMLELLQSETVSVAARNALRRDFILIATRDALPDIVRLIEADHAPVLAVALLEGADLGNFQQIEEILSEADDTLQISLINLLAKRAFPEAAPLLFESARSENLGVATAAASALGTLGSAEASSFLRQLVAEPGSLDQATLQHAQLRCSTGLAGAGPRNDAAEVFEKLLQSGGSIAIRTAALRGLFQLQEDPLAFLKKRIGKAAPELRPHAIRLVSELPADCHCGDTLLGLNSLSDIDRVRLLLLLAERRDQTIRPWAVEYLNAEHPELRAAALQALAKVGTAESVPLLLELCLDAPAREHDLARQALSRIPSPTVDKAIIDNLPSASPSAQLELLQVMQERVTPNATDVLIPLAAGADRDVASEAIRTLGLITPFGELPVVIDLLGRSADPAFRRQVGRTIHHMALRDPDPRAAVARLEQAKAATQDAGTKSLLADIIEKFDSTFDE